MEKSAKRKPLSSAEKVRRYRSKRNNDLAYKQSESKRIEIRKMRVKKMTAEEKEEYRRRATERKRKFHAVLIQKADKLNTSSTSSEPSTPGSSSSTPTSILFSYSTKQSFVEFVHWILRTSNTCLTMVPFWFNRIKQLVLVPRVYLLKWGIRGWRLTAILLISMFFIVSYLYTSTYFTFASVNRRGLDDYSSFYCFTPGPVRGKEGILSSTRGYNYNLRQVQVVIRHGDRAPIVTNALPNTHPVRINCLFNATTTGFSEKLNAFKKKSNLFVVRGRGENHPIVNEVNRCAGGQLTPFGFLQHFFNGEHLKNAYSQFFLSFEWFRDILIYSTSYDRTVQSVSALLFGMFSESLDKDLGEIFINIVPDDRFTGTQFMFDKMGEPLQCPRLIKNYAGVKETIEFKVIKSIEKSQIEKYAEILNVKSQFVPGITKVVDVMVTRLCHNQKLPKGPNGPIDKDLADSSFQLSHRYITAHHKPVSELQTTALISHIVKNMVDSLSSKQSPRLVVFSGHDSTIAPLLLNLGASDGKWPRYASRVIFEVWELDSANDVNSSAEKKISYQIRNLFVRVLYNGQVITNRLRFCKTIVEKELCSAEDLFNYVSEGNIDSGHYFSKIHNICKM